MILLTVGLGAELSLYECPSLHYVELEQYRSLDTAWKLLIIGMLKLFEAERPS